MPREVSGVIPNRHHAAWIVPTAEFQREHYSKREWINGILQQCDDAETAFQNWMERDVQFARWVTSEAESLDCQWWLVDGQHTIEENAELLATHFGFNANS